jgi:hypothetical protein
MRRKSVAMGKRREEKSAGIAVDKNYSSENHQGESGKNPAGFVGGKG